MMQSPLLSAEQIFSYQQWTSQLPSLKQRYYSTEPFPHIVLENFLNPQAALEAFKDFPAIDSGKWIHYVHVNERKYGRTDRNTFAPSLRAIVDELNSDAFVEFLSKLTGIEGLFADRELEGGGLHQSGPGGYLNIHADFTVHPHHRDWRRRVNVLVYLNKDWQDAYGGHLELWDRQMTRCVQKVLPILNRAVIFNTDEDAFHGHPDPIACPSNMSRKSIALYYFTKEKTAPRIRSTEYKARPQDGLKSLWIYLDKVLLRVYDRTKRLLGIDDSFVSNTLNFLDSLKKKFSSNKKDQ